MRRKIIIDTDVGVDDALALLLALNSTELAEILAITTVSGNVHVDQATENCLRIYEIFLQQLHNKSSPVTNNQETQLPPLYKGESAPLTRQLATASYVHGNDGLGGTSTWKNNNDELIYPSPKRDYRRDKTAAEAIIELIEANPNEITLVTLGPLTNVARAIQRSPNTMKQLKQIIIMGGAFETYGNVTLSAEYNIWVDPEATDIVLKSGIERLIFVPLDATEKVWFDKKMLEPFLDKSFIAKYISDITKKVMEFKSTISETKQQGLHMHDPLAVSIALNDDIIPESFMRHTFVMTECEGKHTSGKTIADLREFRLKDKERHSDKNAFVCFNVYPEKFFEFFFKQVFNHKND